jgi:hypothetical protein
MFLLLVAIACSSPSPSAPEAPSSPTAVPHEATSHDHTAPHGGLVQTAGETHLEAVIAPEGVMVYLSDTSQVPLPLDGWTGSATVKGPAGVVTVPLMVMGDHLHAPATLAHGEPATVVVTLSHAGAAVSASFSVDRVGLAEHDHTALHGGVVSMWGELHVEYVAGAGEYRFFLTDARRNPSAAPASGTVKDGATVVPLAWDPATASLWAAGAEAGKRPVMLDATVEGKPVSLAFNPVGG